MTLALIADGVGVSDQPLRGQYNVWHFYQISIS